MLRDVEISLYNPWSILSYLSTKEIKPYWVETGRTDFINEALWASEPSTQKHSTVEFHHMFDNHYSNLRLL